MVTQSKKLIKVDRTSKRLIEFIAADSMVAKAIKEHFGSYCECNVTDWIVDKINNRDPYVFNRLMVLLKAPTVVPFDRTLKSPPSGKLLDRYCDEGRLMARYSIGNDEIVVAVLDENASDYCGD